MDAPVEPSAATRARDPLRALRYLVRAPLLLAHLLVSLPITLLLINPLSARWRPGGERLDHRAIRTWSLWLLRVFGMRVRSIGRPHAGGVLFVANHVSWMDITVLHSQHVMGFVAKSEISRWPLVGWLARRGGTIYHRRGSNESLSGVLHQMVQRLGEGLAVGVFPEGGTSAGDRVKTFHARIFEAAVAAQCPVQPVALKYGAGASAQRIVAFQPGEHFAGNFLRLLGEPARAVEVHFLAPLAHDAVQGRRRMAEASRDSIIAALSP